jgi:serine/threonine protein kinase
MDTPARTPKAVFDRAHEIPDPAERQAYVNQACAGDAQLREKVEGLLRAYDQLDTKFLEKPAPAPVLTVDYQPTPTPPFTVDYKPDPAETIDLPPPDSPASPSADGPGAQIGPYRLLKQLGKGGMGTVYLAEQTQPVRRTVALKLISHEGGGGEIVARFEAERQALALMEHPNIARVLDAGTTPGEPGGVSPGRPYFVMELVQGPRITTYCDQNRLTPRERLGLFVPVCQAVQHAHQKGIIHRDLKPSNLLVGLYDGTAVPKVIDFGVAKALDQKLTEETLHTQAGAIIGTLQYMSPEQADGSPDVDTGSDVYALGAVLYELLTGTPPVDFSGLGKGAILGKLKRIRDLEPPKPSVRVLGSEQGPAIAEKRKTTPARLGKLLRGELDWIVLKCLEKDRARRYESASALARDVQRYLADEPVEATRRGRAPTRRCQVPSSRQRRKWSYTVLLGSGPCGTMSHWQSDRSWWNQ